MSRAQLLRWGVCLALGLACCTWAAQAQNLPLLTIQQKANTTTWSVPVQTVVALTALTVLPAALMLMTSFTRILIVFSLLRQALGLQSVPPNMVLVGLSLFLTALVMAPVADEIYAQAYVPFTQGQLGLDQALARGVLPLKGFMLHHTGEEELRLFAQLHDKPIETREDTPLAVLVPAFAISEIKTGFLAGFLIYLPFLAIDLAVASVLTSLGMVMVSPVMFSLPLKLVLFALADGWGLLAASLVSSYRH